MVVGIESQIEFRYNHTSIPRCNYYPMEYAILKYLWIPGQWIYIIVKRGGCFYGHKRITKKAMDTGGSGGGGGDSICLLNFCRFLDWNLYKVSTV